jgi:alpha-1,2-mannosyltransferase
MQFFTHPPDYFWVFGISNMFSASLNQIADADEVFNYWEPAHYLTYGNGLQTWEYSPEADLF